MFWEHYSTVPKVPPLIKQLKMTNTPRISIIGLGWLGLPLAQALLQKGYSVKGSTSTPEKESSLQRSGYDAVVMALEPAPKGNLSYLLEADVLVVNVPPKAGKMGDAFHPEQMRHLADAVAASAVRWVLYVSSTSVYPELNREVVETDVQTPDESAAPALLQAEQIWQSLQTDSFQVTILRCGGLMGYERQAGKYVAGRTVDSGAVRVNYIHRDDAVGLLVAVLEQGLTGVYNVVAPQHPTRAEVYAASCQKHGYALPQLVEPESPLPFKLVSSAKLIAQTGYSFSYPDPRLF